MAAAADGDGQEERHAADRPVADLDAVAGDRLERSLADERVAGGLVRDHAAAGDDRRDEERTERPLQRRQRREAAQRSPCTSERSYCWATVASTSPALTRNS